MDKDYQDDPLKVKKFKNNSFNYVNQNIENQLL